MSTFVELRTMTMIALMPRIRKMHRSAAVMIWPSDVCILPLESNIFRTTAAMAKPNTIAMPMSAMPQ